MKVILILMLCVPAVGCKAPTSVEIPDVSPQFRGIVTARPAGRAGYEIFAEARPGEPVGDEFYVNVNTSTRFLKHRNNEIVSGSLNDVTVGTAVEIWFAGPILDSYPSQGTAELVLLGRVILEQR